ncbi:hypothetical protein IKG48_01335 [Candidatus Saccharibacteria bacterium]|nr:hypothetical protein [Candidatus Saccharibacteria bacterium]
MKKKILAFVLMMGLLSPVFMPSGNVSADGEAAGASCDQEFLGLRPWYFGLEKDEKCNIKSPDTGCKQGEVCGNLEGASTELAKFIWIIIMNVLVDVFVVAGLVALGFVIYGGYLFLRSGGDVAFATKGRKTLTAALVGLVIVTLANVISRLIVTVLTAK